MLECILPQSPCWGHAKVKAHLSWAQGTLPPCVSMCIHCDVTCSPMPSWVCSVTLTSLWLDLGTAINMIKMGIVCTIHAYYVSESINFTCCWNTWLLGDLVHGQHRPSCHHPSSDWNHNRAGCTTKPQYSIWLPKNASHSCWVHVGVKRGQGIIRDSAWAAQLKTNGSF